jgi:hypothetical protein
MPRRKRWPPVGPALAPRVRVHTGCRHRTPSWPPRRPNRLLNRTRGSPLRLPEPARRDRQKPPMEASATGTATTTSNAAAVVSPPQTPTRLLAAEPSSGTGGAGAAWWPAAVRRGMAVRQEEEVWDRCAPRGMELARGGNVCTSAGAPVWPARSATPTVALLAAIAVAAWTAALLAAPSYTPCVLLLYMARSRASCASTTERRSGPCAHAAPSRHQPQAVQPRPPPLHPPYAPALPTQPVDESHWRRG